MDQKIIILANECYPAVCVGGLGKFIAGISNGLRQIDWQVKVFTPQDGKVYLPINSDECWLRNIRLAQKAFSWCQKNFWFPDWVWVQDWEGAYLAEYWRSVSPQTKIIWTIHSPIDLAAGYGYDYSGDNPVDWSGDFFDFSGLIQKGINNSDLITTVSTGYARNLRRSSYFQNAHQIIGINNGLDLQEWEPTTDSLIGFQKESSWQEFKRVNKILVQEYFGLPQKEFPIFAFVSRLVYQKGIDSLIKILPEFLANNEVQMVIVGQGLRKYEQFLENLKAEFPEKIGMRLKADFNLPHQIFAGADFMVLPSISEPFGLVVAEARQYRAMPIVHAVDGLSDQVKDGLNGLSYPDDDNNQLLAKLYRAIKVWRSSWHRQLVNFNSINIVEDWFQVAQKYDQYLSSATENRATASRWSKEALFSIR